MGALGLVTLRRPIEVVLDRTWQALGREPPRRAHVLLTGDDYADVPTRVVHGPGHTRQRIDDIQHAWILTDCWYVSQ